MSWSEFIQKSQKSQLKSKPTSRKRKLNPHSINNNSNLTKKRKISNIQSISCPICKKNVLSNLINFHIEEHFMDNNNNNKLPTKPLSDKSIKICPLFTSGALPASMFTKGKKHNLSLSNIPAQEAIFYIGIITDHNDEHIISWNAEWIDSSKDKIKSFLLKSKEMDYFITNVMIKEPETIGPTKIYLCCNYASSSKPINIIGNEYRFNYPSPSNWRFSPSLIKSLLQKAIRVSFDDTAVKIGYLLILKDSLQSLLRRLSIIIIEDVILIKDYILLIWLLLVVSKSNKNKNEKYYLKICWYNWLFSLIKKCGQYHIRDYTDFDLHPTPKQYINLFTLMKGDNIKQLLIKCLLIRASYGGMKCDVAMLRSLATIWYTRFFSNNIDYFQEKFYNLSIPKSLEKLLYSKDNINRDKDKIEWNNIIKKNDWLSFINKFDNYYINCNKIKMKEIISLCDNDLILSAVDHHCSNQLQYLCNNGRGKCWQILSQYLQSNKSKIYNNNNEKWRNNVEGLLKLIVWHFRSSITDKISLIMDENKPNELFYLYEKIKPYLNEYAKNHFRARKSFN